MLIAFDMIVYAMRKGPDEKRPTKLVHLNPEHIVSVGPISTGSNNQVTCLVTMSSVNEDTNNDYYTIADEANAVAAIINIALVGLGCVPKEILSDG